MWLGVARVATQGLGAVLTLLAARGLGVAVFGEYALVTSLVAIGNVLTTFGTDTLLIRETARGRTEGEDGAAASAALALQLGLSGLAIGGVAVASRVLPNLTAAARAGLALYALALIPLAFFSVYTALLRGYQRMDAYLLVNLLTVSVQTAGAWAILRLGAGLVALLGWLLAVQAIGAGLAAVFCRRAGFRGFGGVGLGRSGVARIARAAWPLAAISILGIVYQRFGVLALSAMVGGAQVGWFAAASRAVEALKLVHVAALGALLPALASQGGETADGRRLFGRVCGLLAAVSGGIVLALGVGARPLVALLLGPGYAASAGLLQVLSWGLIPYTVSACLSVWEITRGREKRVLVATAAATGVAVVGYPLMVGWLGAVGAAWAAVGVEGVGAAVFLVVMLF